MKEITITRKLANASPIDAILTVHLMLPDMPAEEERREAARLLAKYLNAKHGPKYARNLRDTVKTPDEIYKIYEIKEYSLFNVPDFCPLDELIDEEII